MLSAEGWKVNHKRVERIWAGGRLESPTKAAQTETPMAHRGFLRTDAGNAPQSRLELRLRYGQDKRRESLPDAEHRRRVHQGVPPDPRGEEDHGVPRRGNRGVS